MPLNLKCRSARHLPINIMMILLKNILFYF